MAAKQLSHNLAQEALNAHAKHNGSWKAAAAALGIPKATFQDRLEKARAAGLTPGGHVEPHDEQGLHDKIRRLEAELKAKVRVESDLEIIKKVVGAMKRKVEDFDPPAFMLGQKSNSSPGVPTLFLSDLHWGEVVHQSQINGVNEYNVHIAHDRMQTLLTSAVSLLHIISPKMDYPGIAVLLGGDMISGNIHDELTATNEINSMPAVEDLYKVLVAAIKTLADTFGRVFLACVSGNHGRDTHKIWTKDRHHTSFDWLLYRFLALHFADDKRVTFFIPDGPDAYFRIYEHRYLLTHGDQFRGGDGMIGALGPIIRGDHKKRSRNAQIDMEYDTMAIGHWHQYIHLSRLIVNGSLKGYDEYAYSNNFPFEYPQQALWITHPKYRITFRMPVYVDKRRAAPKTAWASWPK
jgi:hypothetical protein